MATELTRRMIRALLPVRPAAAHKGVFGHVFILAGSRGFTGAAKLAAEGALRSGVGLVTVGAPRSLADIIAASLTEAMSLPLGGGEGEAFGRDAVEPALEFAATKQAVVLGPGMSQHPGTREFVVELVRRCPVPMLVDADGLNCLSGRTSVLGEAEGPRVVTPHPGEMARLVGISVQEVQADRESAAIRFAQERRCVVVLKGYQTVIAAESSAFLNPTGNSGMATGGTGDILSGLVGGLMAQGLRGLDAALVGVYVHGIAGDLAAEAKTKRGMIARDIVESLPEAWRTIEQADSKDANG